MHIVPGSRRLISRLGLNCTYFHNTFAINIKLCSSCYQKTQYNNWGMSLCCVCCFCVSIKSLWKSIYLGVVCYNIYHVYSSSVTLQFKLGEAFHSFAFISSHPFQFTIFYVCCKTGKCKLFNFEYLCKCNKINM